LSYKSTSYERFDFAGTITANLLPTPAPSKVLLFVASLGLIGLFDWHSNIPTLSQVENNI